MKQPGLKKNPPQSARLSKGARKLLRKLRKSAPAERTQIVNFLKNHLMIEKKNLQQEFENGALGGIETAQKMARLHDDLVCALFSLAQNQVSENKTKNVTLCAVGGYGRGEMAPFSDLDLLFLGTEKNPGKDIQILTEYVLYVLWDLGLKVGHAIRTPEQCLSLCREDETILTSLLDLRLLAGDTDLSQAVLKNLAGERSGAQKRKFIEAKLGSRDARHYREGNSRYVIEPNIKEGKGGLRDLHELYWIAKFIYGGGRGEKLTPVNPHGVSAYLKLGLLKKADIERFTQAAEFLWRTRIHLHFLTGYAVEVLSFDTQDAIAKRMGGYDQNKPETRVEHFMRDYFVITREVGIVTRIACAQLESKNALLLPQGLDRFLPTSRRRIGKAGFVRDNGRLNFKSTGFVKKNPIAMLRLFEIAGARNLDIHPDAFTAIRTHLDLIDEDLRTAPEASQIFQNILLESKAPGATLANMNEAGVLGAYVTEFGAIVGLTQFNMHHAYTVDDHTISLIRYLHDIERGEFDREHPISTDFIQNWDLRLRRIVYLACLFHDVGKSKGDQCIQGAKLARDACRRLGLPEADMETIVWLVRHHLEMSETAQRRDISDPATVKSFARTVGSITRLQLLTVLTCVDIRAVGPGIWNDWKGELLRQLYENTSSYLLGETGQEPADRVSQEFLETLDPEIREQLEPVFKSFAASYWQNFTRDQQSVHAQFLANAKRKNKTHRVSAYPHRDKDITGLRLLTKDRPHLFADIAGAIAMCGGSVIGARLHTGGDGTVFNVFYLQNTEGLAFGHRNAQRLCDLEKKCLEAAMGKLASVNIPKAMVSSRAAAIPIRPRVSVGRRGDGPAIIEVEGRDRPGLLYALATVLAAHDLSVRSAHIEVVGPKAIDVFYVGDLPKHSDSEVLKTDLLNAFDIIKHRNWREAH